MLPLASLRTDDGFELARLEGPIERMTSPSTDQAIILEIDRARLRPLFSRDAIGSGRFIRPIVAAPMPPSARALSISSMKPTSFADERSLI